MEVSDLEIFLQILSKLDNISDRLGKLEMLLDTNPVLSLPEQKNTSAVAGAGVGKGTIAKQIEEIRAEAMAKISKDMSNMTAKSAANGMPMMPMNKKIGTE